jgi:hypothetical protein
MRHPPLTGSKWAHQTHSPRMSSAPFPHLPGCLANTPRLHIPNLRNHHAVAHLFSPVLLPMLVSFPFCPPQPLHAQSLLPHLLSPCSRQHSLHLSSTTHREAAAASSNAPQDFSILSQDLKPHTGPWAKYEASLCDGRIRYDMRQVALMELLQKLYLKLDAAYPVRSKPSNLTMLDNVATRGSRSSWCVACSLQAAFLRVRWAWPAVSERKWSGLGVNCQVQELKLSSIGCSACRVRESLH